MGTNIVMTKSFEIVNDVTDILRWIKDWLAPSVLELYTQRLEFAHRELNDAATNIKRDHELTRPAESLPGRMPWAAPISACMDELDSNVIIPLGKNIKSSTGDEWQRFSPKLHEVRAKVEELSRMIEMIDNPTQQELEKMLWWISELGTKEHLGWLLQMRHKLPDRLQVLEEIADRRVSDRVSRRYDADRKLQTFFDLDQREFAHIVSHPDWTKKQSDSSHGQSPVETLTLIRERLESRFAEAEVKQWLREPNPGLNDKAPIEVIKEGDASSVLQLLVELERGHSKF